ncbi:MAG: fructosamine kinase family protein [Candidatus Azobacteroides sp.]|nr:fructosamine kinase family protein [Candidatus Azobacteroides sp.]
MTGNIKERIERITGERMNGSLPFMGTFRTDSGKSYFIKSGASSTAFRCEANGLKELALANALRIAKVVLAGDNFLVTEYIENNAPDADFFEKFGTQFAQLHAYKNSSFGFYENNFIGATPQLNIPSEEEKNNWTAFYFNKRLLYQFYLAESNGYISMEFRKSFKKLEARIESILKGSEEEPALLHGDLWSGNYRCDASGNPVLIDPAVYYGHREADLAMTKIFGGFSSSFYASYNNTYPLKEGWEYRENIYKLYHILNHLNLFGKSYLGEAEYIVASYLK